jgi:hypothetical protein
MTELVSEIMTALKQSQPGVPEQQVQMMVSMRILSGDWTPFDTIRPQLKAYVEKRCNGNVTEAAIQAIAAELATEARDALVQNEAVIEVFAAHLKDIAPEDEDAFSILFNALRTHLPITLGLCYNYTAEEPRFSTKLKDAEIEMIGEILEKFSKIVVNGDEGLQTMLRTLSGKGSQQVAMKYPQHMQAAMLGIPMVLNMAIQFHAEYRKRHNLVPAAAAEATQ